MEVDLDRVIFDVLEILEGHKYQEYEFVRDDAKETDVEVARGRAVENVILATMQEVRMLKKKYEAGK